MHAKSSVRKPACALLLNLPSRVAGNGHPTESIQGVPGHLDVNRSSDPEPLYAGADGMPSVADRNPRIRKRSIDDCSDLEEERQSFIERAALRDGACCYDEQKKLPSVQHPDAQLSTSWFGSNGLMTSRHVRSLFCLELLVLVSVEEKLAGCSFCTT